MGGKKGSAPSNQVEEEMIKAGGFGRYQWAITFIVISGMMCGGFVIHGIALLELPVEEYICSDGSSCTPKEYCEQENPSFEMESIDYDQSSSNIFNWYTKLGLVCKEPIATSLIAMIALVGLGTSCLFMPRLGDLYGRKRIYLFAVFF